MIWLAVALAGGLGAGLRFVVDVVVTARLGGRRPYGTLLVNLTGSLLAGIVAGLALGGGVSPDVQLVAAGGFLGAYTTFSTAMVQAIQELEEDRGAAITILLVTLVGSVTAAAAGVALGRSLAG